MAYLIDETIKAGQDCHVICRSGSAFEKYCMEKGIPSVSRSFSGIQVVSTTFFLKYFLKINEFDIVHVHSAKSHLIAFLSLLIGSKARVVLSRRVDFVPSQSWFTRWRYNHPGIKRIIGVSQAITGIMKSYISSGQDRCITIHDGIDTGKFSFKDRSLKTAYGIPEEKKLIGNTSALADHKDYFTFLDTVKLLTAKRNDLAFIIFGTGPMEQEIKEYAAEIGVVEHVVFAGFVSNIPEVLHQLDVFLMTSKTEGLGSSILDAFACRVPVVATRAGGIPEVVIHMKTGILADVRDAVGLAGGVEKALADPALTEQLTSAAYRHLMEGFTKERMALETIKVYGEVTGA